MLSVYGGPFKATKQWPPGERQGCSRGPGPVQMGLQDLDGAGRGVGAGKGSSQPIPGRRGRYPAPPSCRMPGGLEPRSGNSGPPASRVAEAPRRHFPEGTDKLSCWEVPGKDSPRAGSGHGMVCERRRLGNSDAEVRVPLGWVQGLQGFPIDRQGS